MTTRIGKVMRERRQRQSFCAASDDVDDLDALEALPARLGSVAASRIDHAREEDCSFCFPHGVDSTSWTALKNQRSWKRHRRAQPR